MVHSSFKQRFREVFLSKIDRIDKIRPIKIGLLGVKTNGPRGSSLLVSFIRFFIDFGRFKGVIVSECLFIEILGWIKEL